MPTTLDISHNLHRLSMDVGDRLSAKNMTFAAIKTVSTLAFEGRVSVQNKMSEHFTIRRPWVVKGIRAKPATRSDPTAYVYSVDSAVGDGASKRNFMTLQEYGGIKKPQGEHRIAVPLKGLGVGKNALIPDFLKPKALHRGGVARTVKKTGRVSFISARGFNTLWVESKKKPGTSIILIKRAGGRFVPAWALKPNTKIAPTGFLAKPVEETLNRRAMIVLGQNIESVLFAK